MGLIHDQSHGGCSVIIVTDAELNRGDLLLVRLGKLGPQQARISYVLLAADDVRLVGCEFIGPPVDSDDIGVPYEG